MKKNLKKSYRFLTMLLAIFALTVFAAAVTVQDGKISVSGNKATVTSGSDDKSAVATVSGGNWAATTGTITITNNSGSSGTLSFKWSVSGQDSITDPNGGSVASGTYTTSGIWSNGATVTIKVKAAKKTTATLELSEFSFTEAAASSKVTVNFSANKGSVSVEGTGVDSGRVVDIALSGATLTATPSGGNTFLGWVDGTGKRLSTSTSYTLTPAADMSIEAVFINPTSDDAWFLIDNAYLTKDLNQAGTLGTKIVLMNNGTLSMGSYTINAGDTLLIPFDDAHTLYTTTPDVDATYKTFIVDIYEVVNYAQPTIYRTLNMASGANIAVNGTISLSAKIHAAGGGKAMAGSPVGNVPRISMAENSSITVNSGGKLYCYGFITGSGSVNAVSGATLYECFQIMDYRGGSGSSEIGNSVFPLSQYYVQNIEVPLTLHSGAVEYGVTAMIASTQKLQTSVPFIGGGSMFTISSGSVTKRYDGTVDRLIIDIQGELTMGSVSIGLALGQSIDSTDYILGINNNMTINLVSGAVTVGQRVALLPGAQMTIASGATVTFTKDAFVYDSADWGDFCYAEDSGLSTIQSGNNNNKQTYNYSAIAVRYAPGRTYTRTAADLVDAMVEVEGTLIAETGKLYTTAGGGNICGKDGGEVILIKGTADTTYQARMTSSSDLTYQEISITSAQLHNGEKATKTYTETATATAATTYYYCKDCTTWLTAKDPVAQVIGRTSSIHYHTLAEAVTAYGDPAAGKYIQMLGNTGESVTLKEGTALDLNGKKITGITTISGAFYGADTSGNGYAVPSGSIKLSADPSTVAHVNGRNYVALYDNGCYTFHRFEITPTRCMYYLNENAHSHLAFEATVQGNPTVLAKMTDVGFCVSGSDETEEENWYRDAVENGTLPGHEETISFVAVNFEDDTKFDVAYSVTAKAEFENGGIVSGAAGSSVSFNQAKG